ncbi:MAG: hypothetical protein N4A46_10805 [Schleiferiaceae bacterium]|nr:hypothetical protein [Schleiferiaceae bacterium]
MKKSEQKENNKKKEAKNLEEQKVKTEQVKGGGIKINLDGSGFNHQGNP